MILRNENFIVQLQIDKCVLNQQDCVFFTPEINNVPLIFKHNASFHMKNE